MIPTIHPDSHMGRVHLTVRDLARSLAYYQQHLGLSLLSEQPGRVVLGAGRTELLVLTALPDARRVGRVTGLYHFALLLPSRYELARTLRHLLTTSTPISGASDHAVSEALYLTDPDGHGIEIYRDRPRDEWGFPDGRLKMTVEPFDGDGVLRELNGMEPPWTGIHPATVMGHVHLHVAFLPQAEAFYREVVGLAVMARYGSRASFVSAGGYHHHLGLNTWAGVGAPPPPSDAARLLWFELVVGNSAELSSLLDRLRAAGYTPVAAENGYLVRDPSANGILLTGI